MNEISRVTASPTNARMLQLLPLAGVDPVPNQEATPRIFQLDADFRSGGAWSGVDQLLEIAWLDLLECGRANLVERHAYELYMLLPKHRDRIHPKYLCLTDTIGASERTRFYPMERAYRQVHGLVGMVLQWKQALHSTAQWVVVVRNFDHAQHLVRRFVGELARRAAPGHKIDVIIETALDRTDTAPGVRTMPTTRWNTDLPHVPATLDEATSRRLERRISEGSASVLEQEYPALLAYYRDNSNGLAAAHLALKILALYNRRGYYHEARSFIDIILPYFDELVGGDELRRMSALSEMNSCLVASGNGALAHRLITDLAVPFITRPDLLAHMHYILAMHQLRYVEDKDLARSEHHILQAVDAARSVDEQPFLKAFIDNGLALLRVRQGRPQEALDLCKNAYSSVTAALGERRHLLHRSVLQYNMAQVYTQLGRPEESLENYDRAIKMDPYYTEYYAEAGSILTQLDRHQEAIDAYAKAVAFSPPYPEVYFGKAICHARLEQWQDALDCSGRGLELNPIQPDIRAARAEIFTELGEIEEAIAEYDRGIALDPDSIVMRVNRAVLHYNAGSLDRALADMNHVISLDPQEPAHYENRAIIYQAMDRHDLHESDLATAERYGEVA